ncbi:MAG: YggT family protein [Clostridia bacterium]|nr:YggT family protein [Clostridia bacterium]
MFIFGILEFAISIYALILLVNFLLPLCFDAQKPWMATIAKISEPGVKIGRSIAAKVLPARDFKVDMAALMGCGVFFLLSVVLDWLF